VCPGSSTDPGTPLTLCSGVESNGQTANDQTSSPTQSD